jgi:hypothetical protein
MTVETANGVVRNMMPVVEGDRLRDRNVLAGDPRRSDPHHQKEGDAHDREENHGEPTPQE